MQQYHEIKALHGDALLLFQVGDFYELFFEDAKRAATFLGIALTTRGKNKGEPIPLCGVPMHAKDHYVSKLVKGGFKVAVCDQLEPPRPGTVVKRGVTQVLTPGTLTDAQLLDEKSANYLLSFFPAGDACGLLFGEVLTAQLFATVVHGDGERQVETELARFFPKEILIPGTKEARGYHRQFKNLGYFTTSVSCDVDDLQEQEALNQWLRTQFKEDVVRAVEKQRELRLAIHYFYAFMKRTQEAALGQFHSLNLYRADQFLLLDAATQRNLELVKNSCDGGMRHSLFAVVDDAVTAMGSRMVKKWLLRPLVNGDAIRQRQQAVQLLVDQVRLVQDLDGFLKEIGDIERVVGRVALMRATLHDYLMLLRALGVLPRVRALLALHGESLLLGLVAQQIGDFSSLHALLSAALNDDPSKGWTIKKGFDHELDRLRVLVHNSNQQIVALEQREIESTGIQSLKVRYNNVHGYYIEVTKANLDAVPERYVRRQTLVGKERFITTELQLLESEIATARNQIEEVEHAVFERVKNEVSEFIVPLRKVANALAHLDALRSFACVARDNGYVCPKLNTHRELLIKEGRHPVVERCADGRFIPNDTRIDNEQALWIVTGPNMGGKSTYLRQVALISVLAHCGSFVPAASADVPLLDRVFTRIGAGDNLAEGKSTFLVEMEETAAICSQATERSLVILDEVGRGTSTFDGLAIAQAVVEHIHNNVKARCLFATHYHELVQLQEDHPGIVSYYASSKRTADGMLFLYKMVRGVADGSFGVEVAKLANLPPAVVTRAQELLHCLMSEGIGIDDTRSGASAHSVLSAQNRALQQEVTALREQLTAMGARLGKLDEIDFDNLSPRMAFALLWGLRGGQREVE